jgi:hypothetical protein
MIAVLKEKGDDGISDGEAMPRHLYVICDFKELL